jgi:hypothetical protein
MLNRTNRTLSANLNRLNLGTRSLAVKANGINGTVTLRVLPVHGDSPRDGIFGPDHSMSIRHSSWIRIPEISCSSPADLWRLVRREVEPVVAVPVEASSSVASPVGSSDRYQRGGTLQAQSQTRAGVAPAQVSVKSGGVTKRLAKPDFRLGLDLGCARVRAVRPAVAFVATAGG